MTELEQLLPILGLVVSVITAFLGFRWGIAKTKLSQFRKLVVSVDDALQDNKVTEEEFRRIFNNFKILTGTKS